MAIRFLKDSRRRLKDGNGKAKGSGADPLADFVLNQSLHALMRESSSLAADLHADGRWQRGYCPFCGSHPDFAALDKPFGSRRLVCSLCDSEWHYLRLGCPFCSDETHISYFSDEQKRYRLYVCDNCHHYVKTIDLRQSPDEHVLVAERYLTFGMDVSAQKSGYKPA